MKLTKEELDQMIKDSVKAQVDAIRASGQTLDGEVQVATTADLKQTLMDMGVGYGTQGNGYLVTESGSIINPGSNNRPWVRLSPEMENFANAMKVYIASEGRVLEKVLEEQSDPAGGYLVPEEFQAVLVQYDTEPAVVWPRATIWPMNTDKLGMPKLKQRPDDDSDAFDHFAGVSFVWTQEGGEKTETEPEFEFLELVAHELSGYTEITDTLIEDSAINVMNFLTNLFRRAYVWYTDRTFIRGNGARQPLGVVQDPAVLTVNRQGAGAVVYTDILGMDTKLPSVFESRAVWMCGKDVMNNLRNERDNNNQPVLQQFYHIGPAGIGMKMVDYMLGYPVVRTDSRTYPLGTKGDIILGDWTWYYIGDRKRFTLDTSKHYKFRNNKTAIRVVGRLDGQPAFSEAFVVLDSVIGTS